LLGFADDNGNSEANRQLSMQQGIVVAEEFTKRRIKISRVDGLGASLPVASNATPEGGEKDRRVEIWLRQ
jgi:outer membrane protein OmpA-like peptidoglycan-associated protein